MVRATLVLLFDFLVLIEEVKKFHLESCLRSAEELIKAGADLTAFNNDGKTFLDNEHVLSYLSFLSYSDG
jgi:hypothetical protein